MKLADELRELIATEYMDYRARKRFNEFADKLEWLFTSEQLKQYEGTDKEG